MEDDSKVHTPKSDKEADATNDATKFTALVIEDKPEVSETIELVLQVRWPKARVVTASGGLEGLEIARSEPVDIIILNLGLPDASGLDVLEEIRKVCTTPVIVVTGYSEDKPRQESFQKGANHYLLKPFTHDEFLGKVKEALSRSKASTD